MERPFVWAWVGKCAQQDVRSQLGTGRPRSPAVLAPLVQPMGFLFQSWDRIRRPTMRSPWQTRERARGCPRTFGPRSGQVFPVMGGGVSGTARCIADHIMRHTLGSPTRRPDAQGSRPHRAQHLAQLSAVLRFRTMSAQLFRPQIAAAPLVHTPFPVIPKPLPLPLGSSRGVRESQEGWRWTKRTLMRRCLCHGWFNPASRRVESTWKQPFPTW
jgi:hypothetical protein